VSELDAVVVGSGPNGLTAAARLARAGRRVLVVEAGPTIGGGARTAELTETGFHHDVCAAFHPFGASSPAFAELGLWDRVELLWPDVQFAHPLDGGHAGAVWRELEPTVEHLGRDGRRWRRSVGRFAARWDRLAPELMRPIVGLPRAPLLMASFGRFALRSATALARRFETEAAGALVAGCSAHAAAPLEQPMVGGLGLALAVAAHGRGWPVSRGGSQAIADGLAAIILERGGTIECDRHMRAWTDLPSASVVLFDTSPIQLVRIAGDRLPSRFRGRLERFRPGAGVVKVDYALHAAVPWTNEIVRRAGTVHVGGTTLEIASSERAVNDGTLAAKPYVLVGQQSLIDDTRAPAGAHTLWVYSHVPQGLALSSADIDQVVARMESQIERFAPGFRDTIRARHVMGPADYEAYNPNQHGGDIAGGAITVGQLVARPTLRLDPYRAPGGRGIYLCSASTGPGPGVHGMSGWHAAGSALRHELRD